jgi:hypothetical protein
MSEPARRLEGATLKSIAAARGIQVATEDAELLARRSARLFDEFRQLATCLYADDDVFTFRRLLEQEAAGG